MSPSAMEKQRELCAGSPRERGAGGHARAKPPAPAHAGTGMGAGGADSGKRPGCSSVLPEGLSGPKARLGRLGAGGLGSAERG